MWINLTLQRDAENSSQNMKWKSCEMTTFHSILFHFIWFSIEKGSSPNYAIVNASLNMLVRFIKRWHMTTIYIEKMPLINSCTILFITKTQALPYPWYRHECVCVCDLGAVHQIDLQFINSWKNPLGLWIQINWNGFALSSHNINAHTFQLIILHCMERWSELVEEEHLLEL